VSKPRTIEGRWWIHGDDKLPCFGVLSLEAKEGWVLTAKILQDRAPIEYWNTFPQRGSVSEVIHGRDENNCDVTLFGCLCRESLGSIGLESFHIGSLAGIHNFKGTSLNEPRFQAACVNYTFLGEWMNQQAITEIKKEDDVWCVKIKDDESLEFNPRANIRLKIERKTTRSLPSHGFRAETEYNIWFLFAESKSAQEIRADYVSLFLRLLCLLTGERVFPKNISLFEHNPFSAENTEAPQPCELLFRNDGFIDGKEKDQASYMLAYFCEIKSSFDLVLKRWFECDGRMRPVLDLYFAVLSNRDISYQTKFLLLAQALEVYHARSGRWRNEDISDEEHKKRKCAVLQTAPKEYRDWLKRKISNKRPFWERIDEIRNFCPEEDNRLTANIQNFTHLVGNTRNYYTHYSERIQQSGPVAKGPELMKIGFILEDLLKICLLKEIGIQGKPIERILASNASSKLIHLDTPPVPLD
jgi:ApeA N-terminal domain 1/Apea-like HEPN